MKPQLKSVAISEIEDTIMGRMEQIQASLAAGLDAMDALDRSMARRVDPLEGEGLLGKKSDYTEVAGVIRRAVTSDYRMLHDKIDDFKDNLHSASSWLRKDFERSIKIATACGLMGRGAVRLFLKPTMDGVLSRLDRDYFHLRRDAMMLRRQRDEYARTVPADDPMLEVMDWQLESAQTAQDTRMLELKADHALMEAASERLRLDEEHFEIVEQKKQELAAQRQKMVEEYEQMMLLKKSLDRKKSNGWMFLFLLWSMSTWHWVEEERQKIARDQAKKREQDSASMANKPIGGFAGAMAVA